MVRRFKGLILGVVSATFALHMAFPAAAAPSDADLAHAYDNQAATARSMEQIEQELESLASESTRLEEESAQAQARALEAQNELLAAIGDASLSQEKADDAARKVEVARNDLASVAQAMYRNSARSVVGAYYVLGAGSVNEAAQVQRAYDAVAKTSSRKVESFQTLESAAQTLQAQADAVAAKQEDLAQAAQSAAEEAQEASNAAAAQLESAQARRGELAALLAEQKGTTLELEAQHLAELEAYRQQQAQAASARVINAAHHAGHQAAAQQASAALSQANAKAQASKAAADAAQAEAQRLSQLAAFGPANLKAVNQKAADEAASYAAQLKAKSDADAAQRNAVAAAQKAARERAAQEAAERQAAADAAARQAAQQAQQAQQAVVKPSPTPAPSASSSRRSQIVSYARQYIGARYVWGGTSPTSGWDCSGYVQYVYKHFGINLPRTTWAMEKAGPTISLANAKPGDLVLWSGHVGIYTGNGQHIAARNPALGTREGPLYGKYWIVRVIND